MEKLVWISAFMVIGALYKENVGQVGGQTVEAVSRFKVMCWAVARTARRSSLTTRRRSLN